MPPIAATSAKQVARHTRRVHHERDCFYPTDFLPVRIYPGNPENPYELARKVNYNNGIVNVWCDEEFVWDGASIPALWVLLPWLVTLGLHDAAAMDCIPSWCVWLATAMLLAVTIRIAPYLQKMGRHARGACFHDKLYRMGEVSRAIADAIFLEMMRYDGVPWEARWLIYLNVRLFGWKPYRHWAAVRTANAESGEA